VGYDISYHPVDVTFLHDRVFPFVQGRRTLDDLHPQALRITKVRFRANAWGGGVLRLRTHAPAAFDPDLHVWGRPFFITVESPEEVSDAIDRYLAADEGQVDAIATDMLRQFDPALPGHVSPDPKGRLPDDVSILRGLFWKLDLFREAYAAVKSGRKTVEHKGKKLDAASLFATDFPLAALAFAAHFRPGWMSRGYGWPSQLLQEAGVRSNPFRAARPLFEPLLAELPQIAKNLRPTIVENYVVGGFVPAGEVAALQSTFTNALPGIQAYARKLNAPPEAFDNDYRKIHEALHDARRRNLAFVEATEVYSGVFGAIN
jgi:hypothetical protein